MRTHLCCPSSICQDFLISDNLLHKWGFVDSLLQTTVPKKIFWKTLAGRDSSLEICQQLQKKNVSVRAEAAKTSQLQNATSTHSAFKESVWFMKDYES